jgi:hypothetical protein
MMKKIILLLMMGLLGACTSSVIDVVEAPSVEVEVLPEVIEEEVDTVMEEEIVSHYLLRYHLTHLNEIREMSVSVGRSLSLTPISLEG